jgi:DNA polymerase-3 subunit delta'
MRLVQTCGKVASSTHPDLHILEAKAQEVTIDQVRALQRRLAYRPLAAPRAVAIIVEAERLNLPAANALLKTLEEPPEYAVLILAAPETTLLPPTVVSRCEKMVFAPVPQQELAAALVERRAMAPEVASTVAGLVAGRPGPALEADLGHLKAVRHRAWECLASASRGRAEAMSWARSWFEDTDRTRASQRAQGMELTSALLSMARDLMVAAHGKRANLIHPDLAERYSALVRKPEACWKIFQSVLEAREQLARNLNPQLVVEAMGLAIAEASLG